MLNGVALGGKEAAAPPAAKDASSGFQDLASYVDMARTGVLNAANASALVSVLGSGGEAMHSDADEQLLFSVVFKQPVKLQSLSLAGVADGAAPRVVKVFANLLNADFDDVEGRKPTQEFELSAADAAGAPLQLQYVKFQNVSSLVVFVADNLSGDEVTSVQRLGFVGIPIPTTNMSELKKGG